MNLDQGWKLRLAVLANLVKRAPQQPGRTALMKFAYLLQTCRGIPLGYKFTLYNYGPYDTTVLSDLSQAETLRMLKSEMVQYPSGNVGYQYTSTKACDTLCQVVSDDLKKYDADINWVLDQFGSCTAAELELISTIVFAEREMRRKSRTVPQSELCRRVKAIKPHFDDQTIGENIDNLRELGLVEQLAKAA